MIRWISFFLPSLSARICDRARDTRWIKLRRAFVQRHGDEEEEKLFRETHFRGDSAYLALRPTISLGYSLGRRASLSLGGDDTRRPVAVTTGDAVASWYRHSIALPSSSRLVLLPSPPHPTPPRPTPVPTPHQRSLRTSLSTTSTHANFLGVSRSQDIPLRGAREFAG